MNDDKDEREQLPRNIKTSINEKALAVAAVLVSASLFVWGAVPMCFTGRGDTILASSKSKWPGGKYMYHSHMYVYWMHVCLNLKICFVQGNVGTIWLGFDCRSDDPKKFLRVYDGTLPYHQI